MEALQMFKFALKKECLNFTEGWSSQSLEEAMGTLLADSVPTHNTPKSLPADTEAAVDSMIASC
jgi:hypothetical protein